MKILIKFNVIGLFLLVLVGVSRADVAVPPVGQQIRIELAQNYPDRQFYLASYRRETRPDPDSPHESRPDMAAIVADSFQLRAIELTTDRPFIQPIGNHIRVNSWKLAENAYWLVAVKKGETGAEARIKAAIDGDENVDGVIFARLTDTFETDFETASGAEVVVNRVTGLDENGLVISVEEGVAGLPNGAKPANCIGFGLLLTGLAFFGLWWNKRRFV